MIKVNDKINTDFELDIVTGDEEKRVNFKDLLNRKTIVSVYMKNNTPGCNLQTKSLAEESRWFDEKGYNIVAISKDSCGSHKKYAQKQGINYILASDPDYKFAKATNSLVQKKMFGRSYQGPTRSAYVLDTDGKILGLIEKINTKAHADELKKLVDNL